MRDINGCYVVDYTFDVDDENYKCIERHAFVGVFSSVEKANEAIDYLMNQQGFKDHPKDCFNIDFWELNKLQEWMTGFFSD